MSPAVLYYLHEVLVLNFLSICLSLGLCMFQNWWCSTLRWNIYAFSLCIMSESIIEDDKFEMLCEYGNFNLHSGLRLRSIFFKHVT